MASKICSVVVCALFLAQAYSCPTSYPSFNGCLTNGIRNVNQVSPISSYGGGFPVFCSSPVFPSGLSIVSDLEIGGSLNVCGSVPFVSTVYINGVLPTAGVGTVSYDCGSGNVGIVEDLPVAYGYYNSYAYSPYGYC